MRYAILILILVMTIITNAAKASNNVQTSDCYQEQVELIIENEDSYTTEEINQQYKDAIIYCLTLEQSSSK